MAFNIEEMTVQEKLMLMGNLAVAIREQAPEQLAGQPVLEQVVAVMDEIAGALGEIMQVMDQSQQQGTEPGSVGPSTPKPAAAPEGE